MTADLERELRRLMADPPVDTADADAIGPVAALGRRVARVRARRRVATLSAVVVLVGGLSGAAALTVRSAQVSSSASPASGQAAGSDRGERSVPTEVAEATRTALAQLRGGTPSGPAQWVSTPYGYLVQIRLAGTATCRYCQDPAMNPKAERGTVLQIRVPTRDPTVFNGSSSRSAGGPRAQPAPVATTPPPVWTLLNKAGDLSRYGVVHQFTP